MPDMICPLFDIPDYRSLMDTLAGDGILIRAARPWDREALKDFISARFGQGWVDETLSGFSRTPISVVIALKENKIVGFAAYEVTAPGFFGPTGVDDAFRGKGIGKALLYESLDGLKRLGYVYGIIGSPGPVDFYLKAMKGMLLPMDWKTIYTDALGATAVDRSDVRNTFR